MNFRELLEAINKKEFLYTVDQSDIPDILDRFENLLKKEDKLLYRRLGDVFTIEHKTSGVEVDITFEMYMGNKYAFRFIKANKRGFGLVKGRFDKNLFKLIEFMKNKTEPKEFIRVKPQNIDWAQQKSTEQEI